MSSDYKECPGYPQYYATYEGKVYSKKSGNLIQLKPSVGKDGFVRYNLNVNKNQICVTEHKLIALTYIPNPNNFKEIKHKDGNRSNNTATNLEWYSHAETYFNSGKKNKVYKVFDKNGYVTTTRNLPKFCLDNNLVYNSLHKTRPQCKNRTKFHRGFRIELE